LFNYLPWLATTITLAVLPFRPTIEKLLIMGNL
jgi:hypothetical protein